MTNRTDPVLTSSPVKGYRLQKLELLNWGTFDGEIYCVRPAGSSALLIGQNGSGKSTLVDALLTLLVRPGMRNFNVAAGSRKRERSEKSYLLGAYDRGSDEDRQNVRVKYLRPKGERYAVILACFQNEEIGKTFTLAQVLYLASDQSVEKVYCFANDERSIRNDFSQLDSSEAILKTLKQRGLRSTKTFQEYEGWFQKTTRVKAKAMEVFNETVAVKDIQKLNDFIRHHMLEAHDWSDKVDRLLGHFTQLSEAHDSLVKVREQRDLLEPVAALGGEFREQAGALERAERLRNASTSYFLQQTIRLSVPAIERNEQKHQTVRKHRESLASEIRSLQENSRSLQNQIDQAGGDRLREIPRLIDLERERADRKRQTWQRIQDDLRRLGVETVFKDEDSLGDLQSQLPGLRRRFEAEAERTKQQRIELIQDLGERQRQLNVLRNELAGLEQRRANVPEWCVQLRKSLCEELGLAVGDLPFAAELMQVRHDEREWEASIEKVLRGLALSLLVPDCYYSLVAEHLERTRLVTQGRGQRLRYLRASEWGEKGAAAQPGRQSLVHKLEFREGHHLLPWLKAELSERFDYACCETIQDVQTARGPAMTRNRHVKAGRRRHEKDDRDRTADPQYFVLGWDNRQKKRRLSEEIERLARTDHSLKLKLDSLDRQLADVRAKLSAVEELRKITCFSEINFEAHEREIGRLENERRAIESHSDTLKALKRRLTKSEDRCRELQETERRLIGDERILENEISDARKLVGDANGRLRALEADGRLENDRLSYAELDAEFADSPLTIETLFETRQGWLDRQDRQIVDLRGRLEPIQNELTETMSRFLRGSPEESADLRASIDYLDGFLDFRQRILEDDLPRHERRFKKRLNQKVTEEIGLFRSALEQERREIEDKIELLNVSLKQLEYRPGNHIQLRPKPIRDAEITDFQSRLRECVEGSFEDSAEANEARFVRIKNLIARLRDDENRRWREKVTDVRRWFDFVAEVIDRNSLETVSVYQDSSGQSGGEKAKLAFTILVAAIAYQYDLDPEHPVSDRFHFVIVDEMFSKVDDQHAEYALELFRQFGLQLLIVAPLDAKARVTQPYVGCYLHVVKKNNRSSIFEMTAADFDELASGEPDNVSRNRSAVS